MFLNKKTIPLITLLYYDNCFITDFKEKAELFHSFSSKQCSLIFNDISLPRNSNRVVEVLKNVFQNPPLPLYQVAKP